MLCLTMTDSTTPPEVVVTLSEGAPRLVMERLRFGLDYTVETLPVLDQYLLEIRAELDDEEETKVAAFVVPTCGAYFGEVVRRSLPGARWEIPEDEEDYAAYRLAFPDLGLAFNPFGVALEALHGEALAGWHAHLEVPSGHKEAVEEALKLTGGVREEDFYRLALRWEVLEQTTALLTELRRQGVPEIDPKTLN
jgi:hypothetical protein